MGHGKETSAVAYRVGAVEHYFVGSPSSAHRHRKVSLLGGVFLYDRYGRCQQACAFCDKNYLTYYMPTIAVLRQQLQQLGELLETITLKRFSTTITSLRDKHHSFFFTTLGTLLIFLHHILLIISQKQ